MVIIVTDNTQVTAALNTEKSRNKTTMAWLRLIFWGLVTYNFDVQSVYIKTNDNVVSDSLNRLNAYKNIAGIRDAEVARLICCHEIFSV